MTYVEQFNEAMSCETIQEADAWLAKQLAYYQAQYRKGPTDATRLILQNIAYGARRFGGQEKADRLYLKREPAQLTFGEGSAR